MEPENRTQTQNFSPGESEKLRELILRLTSVCSANNRQTVQAEATIVVALCKPHAPLDVLEEAIQAIAPHQPTLPRFLFKQFQLRCAAHHLPAPLLTLPDIGRKVS